MDEFNEAIEDANANNYIDPQTLHHLLTPIDNSAVLTPTTNTLPNQVLKANRAYNRTSSQHNAFPKPEKFTGPTPYRSAASFVREFED